MTRRGSKSAAIAAAALLLAAGCGKERAVTDGVRECASYKEDVAPLLQNRCATCHAGDDPAGGYDVSTYFSAIAGKSDTPVATAGDSSSPLLKVLDSTDKTHSDLVNWRPTLEEWVVECRLAWSKSDVHPGGIMNPKDDAFHGKLVRNSSYDFGKCTKCHGEDFAGGKANASCLTCHKDKGGPTACSGCHGAPPATGAHLAHTKAKPGTHAAAYDCVECHVKPADYKDPGHLFDKDGKLDEAPAEITFGATAKQSYEGTPRKGDPAWSVDGKKCSNVYCHGGAFADTNAKNTAPSWTGGASQAECGTCHGLAPSSHKDAKNCVVCHAKVVDGAMKLVDAARHIDGKVSLGDESGKCWACHGSPDHPEPPRDLAGKSDPASISVGAHAAHLNAPLRLGAPVKCGDCHAVPQKVNDPGHVDSDGPAEVFPASIAAQSVAFKDGAKPAWDRVAGTCSNVYCHGAGTKLDQDKSPARIPNPKWTGDAAQVRCGACHGVPPVDGIHDPKQGIDTCYNCHADTVDKAGSIVVSKDQMGNAQSKHLNGAVDVKKP